MSERGALLALVLFSSVALAEGNEARQLYEEGARLYQVESYAEAIEAFKRSYVLSANPGLLYNIAQAYRMSGHCSDALRYYRSYLEQRPNAADRAAVEALITKTQECADREPAPPPPAPPKLEPKPVEELDVTPAPAPPERPIWGLALSAGGLAVALGGAGLQVAVRVRYGELITQCPCPRESWLGWRTAEAASWVLVASGAAVALGGLGAWLFGAPTEQRVSISFSGSGVTLWGKF